MTHRTRASSNTSIARRMSHIVYCVGVTMRTPSSTSSLSVSACNSTHIRVGEYSIFGGVWIYHSVFIHSSFSWKCVEFVFYRLNRNMNEGRIEIAYCLLQAITICATEFKTGASSWYADCFAEWDETFRRNEMRSVVRWIAIDAIELQLIKADCFFELSNKFAIRWFYNGIMRNAPEARLSRTKSLPISNFRLWSNSRENRISNLRMTTFDCWRNAAAFDFIWKL